MKKSPDAMDEITSRDSAIYARLLIGRARQFGLKAAKELAHIDYPAGQCSILFFKYHDIR